MMLYLASNTRTDISFAVHQCVWFTNNTKVSHEKAVKRICNYLQDTKDNVLVFNPYKKLVMDCYDDTYFAGLWGYVDPKDPIGARSRTGFVVTFQRMTASSKHIVVKYNWFRQHVGKEIVIRKIESENQKTDIFTKSLQGRIFARINKLL